MNHGIITGFLQSSTRYPDRRALEVEGRVLSYRELRSFSQSIASTLQRLNPSPTVPLTGVFGYRSTIAYAGILAALHRGHGYVPLNRTFPVDRTRTMLRLSGCDELIVDAGSMPQLAAVLEGIDAPILVLGPLGADRDEFRHRFPQHRFASIPHVTEELGCEAPAVADDAIAYLLFTSGSTGTPKGVMVTHANVRHYVDHIVERYEFNESDRFSQMFDMTFDLSVADMFVAWNTGACVCCPGPKQVMAPGQFMREANLSVWFSVPSTAIFMKRLGMLKPGAYPDLRVSMFCGEAFPMEVARDWQEAAPNSIVDNLYGPTELTIACTAYRWDDKETPAESELGCVPIGYPFPGMKVLVANEGLEPVGEGDSGELLMAGPQQAKGYWRDPERTATAFVKPPHSDETYYRTGDRVRWRRGRPLVYLGRMDNQVKVLGHRVELGEVESVARDVCGIPAVVAVAWPATASGATGIEIFVETEDLDGEALLEQMALRLPAYMVPRHVHPVTKFPLNINGKYDRRELTNRLNQGKIHAISS